MKAFNTAGLSFPWRHRAGPRKGRDRLELDCHVVLWILHNPRYAGAFTFGRHRDIKLPGGKLSRTILPREEWISFIPGAHPGYITLDQYDANRAQLAANAAAHGRDRAAGPPREGPAETRCWDTPMASATSAWVRPAFLRISVRYESGTNRGRPGGWIVKTAEGAFWSELVLDRGALGRYRLDELPDDLPVLRVVPVDLVSLEVVEVGHHGKLEVPLD